MYSPPCETEPVKLFQPVKEAVRIIMMNSSVWVEGTFPLKHQNMLLINWFRPGQKKFRVAEVSQSLGSGHKPDWLQSQTKISPVLRFIFLLVIWASWTSEAYKLPEDFVPRWKKKKIIYKDIRLQVWNQQSWCFYSLRTFIKTAWFRHWRCFYICKREKYCWNCWNINMLRNSTVLS